MKFYLTNAPLNASYTNEEGQVLFKVETDLWSISPTSYITRVIPNDALVEGGEGDVSLQDKFEYFGHVKHNKFGPSVLHFGNEEFPSNKFFRKVNEWGTNGRHRIFTGRDGREYKWLMRAAPPKLILNDGTNTQVAKFRSKCYGIIGKAHPSSLEIFEAGEHMVQEILVTYVHIEKLRRDRDSGAH